MEINCYNSWQTLPTVIEAISRADCIFIDLEMTGVSGPSLYQVPQHTEVTAYQLAIDAARTFQILQVGLTCISHDYKQQGYSSRTFTFQLSPEFVHSSTALAKLIDRKIVLSYRSFLFQKENDFSFDHAFSQGVPYLSRCETSVARRLYLNPGRDLTVAAEGVPASDVWRRKFFSDTSDQISAWLEIYPKSVSAMKRYECGMQLTNLAIQE